MLNLPNEEHFLNLKQRNLMKKTLRKKSKISIIPVGLYDDYDVGNWTNYDTSLKLGYKDDDYDAKIYDISFCLVDKDDILGYFKAYNVINVDGNDIIPLYSKKLVLYDFAISARAYAKYGLILINFLINYAKNNGYSAVEIKKVSKYSFFLDFLNRHFKLDDCGNEYYFLIDKPKINSSEKHLSIYESDNVKIEDIYFLYDLGFYVGKKVVSLKLNDKEWISVNRTSGKIKFPTNVEILNDEVILNSHTKSVVFLICEMYNLGCVKNLKINFSSAHPNAFEAYADDLLYVNKDIPSLIDDPEYVSKMMQKGINRINPYIIDYDINSRTISRGRGEIKCEYLIKRHSSR